MISDFDLLLLNALVDQELDAAASLDVERRIVDDPDVAAAHARILATKQAVARLEKPEVSDDFYNRMSALASPNVAPLVRSPKASRPLFAGEWRAIAASVVVTACLASGATYQLTAPSTDQSIRDAVIGDHQRSLLASNTVDVVSSDRHTVRPWFDAKLGMSPPAVNLADKGFPLIGGRVEVVGGKAVPTLVYGHEKHLISVVAIPQTKEHTERSPTLSVVDGYNLCQWSHGGFRYWAISDLDADKLEMLADNLIAQRL